MLFKKWKQKIYIEAVLKQDLRSEESETNSLESNWNLNKISVNARLISNSI